MGISHKNRSYITLCYIMLHKITLHYITIATWHFNTLKVDFHCFVFFLCVNEI